MGMRNKFSQSQTTSTAVPFNDDICAVQREFTTLAGQENRAVAKAVNAYTAARNSGQNDGQARQEARRAFYGG